MNTLLVEDSPDMRRLVERALRRRGHDVTACGDAETAWEARRRDAFPLMIVDWMLPGMDGLQLCRQVRALADGDGSVIVVMTAHDTPGDLAAVLDAGADDYLAKPFSVGLLEVRLTIAERQVAQLAARNRAEVALRQQAETDALTGLANRRKSAELLERYLRLAHRDGKHLALALLDLDHFKRVNDRHGHATGDEVLRRVGELLRRWFREEDVVARWGGEEFAVGMYGSSKEDGARHLDRVLAVLREEDIAAPDGSRIRTTFSGGVAEYPTDGADVESLYRVADGALYRAKASGRARVVTAAPCDDPGPSTEGLPEPGQPIPPASPTTGSMSP